MLLHITETMFPINSALYLLSYRNRFCEHMGNHTRMNLYIFHRNIRKRPGIRCLPALLREKERAIQYYFIQLLLLLYDFFTG